MIKTPIVALTAFAMKVEIEEILNSGCIEYLSKPITRTDLLKFIARFQDKYLEKPSLDQMTSNTEPEDDGIDELIPQYLENRRSDIPKLEAWLKNQDMKNLKSFNHKLKGTALSYKQVELDRWSLKMSEALQNEDIKGIEILIEDYKKQLGKA